MTYVERTEAAIGHLLSLGIPLTKNLVATCAHDKGCPAAIKPVPCICTPRITIHTPRGPYQVDPQGKVSNPAASN
jgi:hypothetical protein